MTTSASFTLERGTLLSPAAVCATIVHRPTRDAGFPLVAGLVCGALSLGLLVAALVTLRALPALLLVVLELLLAAGLGWMASWLLPDALAARRYNRRGYEVRFELERVEIRSADGVEQVALADAPAHPFLRALAIDGRVHALVRVRAACEGLPPRADVRLVLETLVVQPFDDASVDGPEPPPRPCYAVIVDGEAQPFRDPEDLAALLAEGTTVYRIDTVWDPVTGSHAPRLVPAAVTRVAQRLASQ